MNKSKLMFRYQISGILILLFILSACMPFLETMTTEGEPVENEPAEVSSPVDPTNTIEPSAIPTETSLPPTETPTAVPPTATPIPEMTPLTEESLRLLFRYISTELEFPRKVAWNENGNFSVLTEEEIVTLDRFTLETLANFSLNPDVQLLDFSPNGELIALTSDMFSIEIIEITSGNVLQFLEPGEQFMSAHFSPDSNRLLIPSLDNIKGIEYDVHTGTRLNEYTGFTFAGPVYDVFYSKYTNDLIWVSRGSVRVMNRETGELSPYFGHEDFVSSIALSPDGQILITAAAATINDEFTPALYFWSRTTGEQLSLVPLKSYAKELTITPDGSLLIAAVESKLFFYQPVTQELLLTASGHADQINLISLAPDSKALVTASFDNSVVLWQIRN